MVPYSLYIHIPFCVHRCAYCDFNTYAGLGTLIPEYARAVSREAEILGELVGSRLPVHTIFFGGGTPSLLPIVEVGIILDTLEESFDLQPAAEISLEANPGTVDLEKLSGLRALGVNRLSLGMQSANPEELRLLERQHDYGDVIQAVKWARLAGFDNLNLDLIFGLPHQSLATWEHSLELALGLHPEHLSLYALTLEHGTPMQDWVDRGLLPEPDPDLAADMYELASDRLETAGFCQYEISNWARTTGSEPQSSISNPTYACRHNLQYWRNQPYLGLGAGAHGYAGRLRVSGVLTPAAYIQRFKEPQQPLGDIRFPHTPATVQFQEIDRAAEIAETMMMGLRLVREGVSRAAFQTRFGQDLEAVFAPQIHRLSGFGLLEWAGENQEVLRLTQRGRLLGNQVFVEFI